MPRRPRNDAHLRKVLWTLYWRGSAQLRQRIEDELRPPDRPKVSPKQEPPHPDAVLDKATRFVELAEAGAYMAGDRRVHHTERSKWRRAESYLKALDAAGRPHGAPGLRGESRREAAAPCS